jgi:hypothetical protein
MGLVRRNQRLYAWFVVFLVTILPNFGLATEVNNGHGAAHCIRLLKHKTAFNVSEDPAAFASRLKQVAPAEVAKRFEGNSIHTLTGMTRNSLGHLIPVFEGTQFQSLRDNLPEGLFGGTGWNSNRKTIILSLASDSFDNFKPHLDTLAHSLPKSLQELLQNQSLVTQKSYDARSEYQILMQVAPSNEGRPTGGRSGILLHREMPIVIRDQTTGHEYLIELKGAGSVMGGYQKDQIEGTGFGQRGGEWGIIGGAYEIAVEREHLMTNHFAFNILGRPQDAVLSLGYVAFEKIGKQALTLRLTPGNLRATYLFNNESLSSEVVARYAKQMSSLIFKALLAGKVPMTHPENFVGSKSDPILHMTDFSDMLPYRRFPVNWGFNWRELRETIYASLHSITQVPGFREARNLSDVKEGLLDGLVGSPLDKTEIRKLINGQQNMEQLITVVYNQILIYTRAESESLYGRVPQWAFKLGDQLQKVMYRTREQIEAQVLSLPQFDKVFKLHESITELNSYPQSKNADSFQYFIGLIKQGILLRLTYSALESRTLTASDTLDLKALTRFFELQFKESENFLWSRVEDRLGKNKYALDIKEALSMSPAQAAKLANRHISQYSGLRSAPYEGSVSELQSSVTRQLENEILELSEIARISPQAQSAAEELQAHLAYIKNLSVFDFAERFLQKEGELYRFMIVPYYQIQKYRDSPQFQIVNVRSVINSIN